MSVAVVTPQAARTMSAPAMMVIRRRKLLTSFATVMPWSLLRNMRPMSQRMAADRANATVIIWILFISAGIFR